MEKRIPYSAEHPVAPENFAGRAEQNNCTGTIIELGEATDSFLTLFETITQNLRKKL